MKIESAGLSTCDARLDDEAQRCGLHVRESGRLWRKLEKVRVQLRGGAHAQVAEFGYTVPASVCHLCQRSKTKFLR